MENYRKSFIHNNRVNTLASGRFRGCLWKKTPKRTWLCAGISPVR